MFKEKVDEAKQLYKKRDYKNALVLFEELKEEDLEQFNHLCKHNYMWSLYRYRINKRDAFDSTSIEQTNRDVEYIISNLKNDVLLYQMAVLSVLKHYEQKEVSEPEVMDKWLDKLDPELLTNDPNHYKVKGKKEIIYPGNKETWYVLKTKVSYELGNYKTCIKVSDTALEKLSTFQNNNDIWLKRRMALSYEALGENEQALNILIGISKGREEWFLFEDIGNLYRKTNEKNNTLNNYIKALLNQGIDNYKVELISKIADFVKHSNNKAYKLFMEFAIKIKLMEKLEMNQAENDYLQVNREKINRQEYKLMKVNVKKMAEDFQLAGQERHEGFVLKLLENGNSGFIKDDKDSYFFKFKSLKNAQYVVEGREVTFNTQESYDQKRNKTSIVAVNIVLKK